MTTEDEGPTVTITTCRRSALIIATALVVLAAGGCTPSSEPSVVDESVPAQVTLEAMRPEAKREVMAEGFPVEVPVPTGQIVRTRAQGPDVWDYEIVVEAAPDAVAQWYADAYTGRSWVIVRSGELDEVQGGYFLEMRKNAAESRVDVIPGASEGSTTAKVVVGVGTPVLGTF